MKLHFNIYMTLKREFVYVDEGILYGYGYEPDEVGSVDCGNAYFVPDRKRKDISDSEEEDEQEEPKEESKEEPKEESKEEPKEDLTLQLSPIEECKVRAVSEETNEEYTYNSIPEAALDLKIYPRMIHHALDQENQSLWSKRLRQRLYFFRN